MAPVQEFVEGAEEGIVLVSAGTVIQLGTALVLLAVLPRASGPWRGDCGLSSVHVCCTFL